MTNTLPEIRKTIVLKAPIDKIWNAIATSKGIGAWWMPNNFEPTLNHEFVLHAGQFGDSPCKVTELELQHKVGFDWGKDWHLTMELKEIDTNLTEFTLVHSGWDEEKNTEFGQPHTVIHQVMDNGWEGIINKSLLKYIEA